MAQHVQSEWGGFIAIHRYEDLAVIRSVIESQQPIQAVELGTAEGGFAAFLATVLWAWGGTVYSVDIKQDQGIARNLESRYKNLCLIEADVLSGELKEISYVLKGARRMLYTDNGHKQRELELYAPLLGPGGLVGTHDYGTEVDPVWAEPYMQSLGYSPYQHGEFEALVDPTDYPVSYTRFWTRA